jgi:hypothetical protein
MRSRIRCAAKARCSCSKLLQREGRLVDFLEQDVQSFCDEDVGAAARVVHEGCRKSLRAHLEVEPIRGEAEGATLTLEAGYDARAIKLVGDVRGSAPYPRQSAPPRLAREGAPVAGAGRRPRRERARDGGGGAVTRLVGIDLGTTHTALAHVDAHDESARPELFAAPQFVARGKLEARTLLPSFLYFAHESEGRAPPALGRRAQLRRRRVRTRPRCRGTESSRLEREELALPPWRRSPQRPAPAERPRRHRDDQPRRGLLPLPRSPRGGLARREGRAALGQRHRADGAGVVRCLGARSHGGGRARRRAREPHPARGAAGRALRLDRLREERASARSCRSATCCS